MLFNSAIFILVFVPFAAAGFQAASRWGGRQAAIGWLIACSVVFYAGWHPSVLWVPLVSLAGNWIFASLIARHRRQRPQWAKAFTAIGVALNVALLASYKLVDAGLLGSAQQTAGMFSTTEDLLIPIGLSFITFQQIAFLIDIRDERIHPAPLEFTFFIMFFPQLVMGPIVHFREIIPQTHRGDFLGLKWENVAIGLSIFAVGLFKKVGIADPLAAYVNVVFAPAKVGAPIGFVDAWGASLAFQFQVYFDFSGYADMAIGLARIFNLAIPINFDCPLRATDRFDLWRRWHITFAMFMRRHVFWVLRRNRTLPLPAPLALFLTVFIGGLWHGLGLTFAAWATAQAVFMLAGHYRREAARRFRWRALAPGPRWRRILITFITGLSLAALFRGESLPAAAELYKGMLGFNGLGFPTRVTDLLGLASLGTGVETYMGGRAVLYLPLAAFIVFALPPTQVLFARFWTALDQRGERLPTATGILPAFERRLRFDLTFRWALFVAALFILAALSFDQSQRFVYFQF